MTRTPTRDRAPEDLEAFARHACSTNPAVWREYERFAACLRPGRGDLCFLVERLTRAHDSRRRRRSDGRVDAAERELLRTIEHRLGELRFWHQRIAEREESVRDAAAAQGSFLACSRQVGMLLEASA